MYADQSAWFALRVRNRCEAVSSLFLRYHNFVVCSPNYVTKRQWSDRTKRLEVPLFPGYVFCQMALSQRVLVLNAPGVVQIVGIGNTPVAVDPSEMDAILRSIEYGLRAEPAEMPKPMDRVLIQSGPFRGLEGVVTQLKKRKTVILTVTLLQRAIAVEIDETAVLPLSRAATSACGGLA